MAALLKQLAQFIEGIPGADIATGSRIFAYATAIMALEEIDYDIDTLLVASMCNTVGATHPREVAEFCETHLGIDKTMSLRTTTAPDFFEDARILVELDNCGNLSSARACRLVAQLKCESSKTWVRVRPATVHTITADLIDWQL